MNGTPRALNRVLLTLIGLLLTALGGLAVALALFPGAADGWRRLTDIWGAWAGGLLAATTLTGQRDSWLWILVAALLLAIVALMIIWVANQGRGRVGTLAAAYDDEGAPGRVELSAAVAEQALKAALAERGEIVNSSVSTWEFKRRPGLKIRILPRQGAAPYEIAEDVSALACALDEVLGRRTPVVIHIAAGARTRFMRAERVS